MKKNSSETAVRIIAASVLTALAPAVHAMIPMTLEEAQAVAEEDLQNHIEADLRYAQKNSGNRSTSAAWNAIDHQGAGADASFSLSGRTDAWDWQITGDRLGTDTRTVSGKVRENSSGIQVNGGYQRFTHQETRSGRTLSQNDGSLPAGLNLLQQTDISGTSITNPREVDSYLKGFTGVKKIEQVRDVYQIGAKMPLTDHAEISGSYQYDHRHGNDTTWANVGGTILFGNAQERIYNLDDSHHQLETGISFTGSSYSLSLGYYLSKFENDRSSVWTEALTLPGTWLVNVPDPSNTLHQLSFDGSFSLPGSTSLSVSGSYGVSSQDESFSGYNTGLSYTAPEPSLNGKAKNPVFDISLNSHPLDRLSLRAHYHFDSYRQTGNFGNTGWEEGYSVGEGFTFARPYNYKKHKADLEANYRLTSHLSLKAYGKYTDKRYDQYIRDVKSAEFGTSLRRQFSGGVSGKFGYRYEDRDTGGWWNQTSETNVLKQLSNSANASKSGVIWNRWSPASWSPYKQHTANASLNFSLSEAISVDLSSELYSRTYKERDGYSRGLSSTMLMGSQSYRGFRSTAEIDWAPGRDFSVFAYYSYDQTRNKHSGLNPYENGGTNWLVDVKDISHSIGAGLDLHPEGKKWKAGLQYYFSFDKTRYGLSVLSENSYPKVPTISYRTHTVECWGSYDFSKRWQIRGALAYERAKSYDWRLENGGIGSTQGSFSAGITSPNYGSAIMYVGLRYRL